MGKAFEISVWKPHAGMRVEFMKNMKEIEEIFLEAGVSKIRFLDGVAGKDVGNIVVIQTFKGLTDNGAINEKIGEMPSMKKWIEKHGTDDFATLISHDLYSEV